MMNKYMLLSLILIISILTALPLMLTPISMGIWIIVLAMLNAVILSMSTSSWFGFILLLLYIGGLLVMFAYFVAINPNNKIKLIDPILLPTLMLLMIITMMKKSKLMLSFNFSNTMLSSFASLTSTDLMPLLLIMASTLLLILISVVKITKREQGALRPHMKHSYV